MDPPLQDRCSSQVTPIPKPRHIPERSCIACGRKGPKGDLVRVVRAPDGSTSVDVTGRANGRGAYLCRQPECWDKGLAKRALEKSLRKAVSSWDLDSMRNFYLETIASAAASNGMASAGDVVPNLNQ